jgi:hypothetical protein
MSGSVQRQIISLMMELSGAMTVDDLCSLIYRGSKEVTNAQRFSVRRALKRLAEQKIVRRSSFAQSGYPCWTFIGVNADRTGERLQKLRAIQRVRNRPTLVK